MKMKHTGLFILLMFVTFFQINAETPDAPYNLRCYDKTNPVGISNKPYFAWYISDADNDEIQSAYQIIVSSCKINIDSKILCQIEKIKTHLGQNKCTRKK